MKLAIADASIAPDACLIDAVQLKDLPYRQLPIIGGDGKSVSIAAASVVAKVTRDRIMAKYAEIYPQYGFEKTLATVRRSIWRLWSAAVRPRSIGGRLPG